MARFVPALIAAAVATVTLAGCGTQPQSLAGARVPASVKAKADDHDVTHAKLNAIVKATLVEHKAFVFGGVDGNRDGKVTKSEYAQDRQADAVNQFFASFDGNGDGAVTATEYDAGLKGEAAIEAYHHLTEARMGAAIKPYTADKSFEAEELRDYMTKDLGMTADWPFIYQILAEIDLNGDDKVLNSPGEGPAFLLKFAKPQLQQALGMPVGFQAAARRK
jgi:hypothetical protein